MPIPVACQCGQQFSAPDNLAGRTVQCPKCGAGLAIPHPQAQVAPAPNPLGGMPGVPAGMDPNAAAGGVQCPSCFSVMPGGAVMCIECGYNVTTGEQVESVSYVEQDTKNAAVSTPTEQMLAMAEETMEEDAKEAKKTDGLPWYVYLLLLAAVIGFAAAMVALNNSGEEEEDDGPSSAPPPAKAQMLA